MTDPVRVLVTGSRTWPDATLITAALDDLHQRHGHALVVVHGTCPRGADAVADLWCHDNEVPVERHPADWKTHGRRAGMKRNESMVDTRPALCLAFIHNASPGASHCAGLAEAAGIPTDRHIAGNRGDATDPGASVTPARSEILGLQRIALDLAARGWPVFPLRPGDKRPAFPDHEASDCPRRADTRCRAAGQHQGWEQRATVDPGRITRGWSGTAYNVGIACGPAGLLVVDLDTPKPDQPPPPPAGAAEGVQDGADVFAVLCQRAGQPWPVTYTVRTGRGGRHLYFRHPPGDLRLGNTSKKLGWLVDTRGWGGQVVAGGSMVDGRFYTVEWDTDPIPLPGWLAEALTPRPLPPQESTVVTLSTDRRGAYLRRALDGCTRNVLASAPEDHNNALYRAAVGLGQLVAGKELTEEQVIATLLPAAMQVGQGQGEALKTIRSGLRAGAARPRSVAA